MKALATVNEFRSASKGGMCYNANHRDAGYIIHLVKAQPKGVCGYWGDKAVCGVTTGRRGYGWSERHEFPNCEKCLNKMIKALGSKEEFRSAGKLTLDDKLRFWSLLKRRAASEDVQGEIDNLLNK